MAYYSSEELTNIGLKTFSDNVFPLIYYSVYIKIEINV